MKKFIFVDIEYGYIWIWRFLITWQFDEVPTLSLFDESMESEHWEIRFTTANVIKLGYAIVFLFIVIVALHGEFIR